jgi:PAS domain S-box-containing protein
MSNAKRIGDVTVSLESVISTDQLSLRPNRPPDYETESHALLAIAQQMGDSAPGTLQKLAEVAREICRADAGGVTLLSKDSGDFYSAAIAGPWKPHLGQTTPRNSDPSGVVLDRGAVQLFNYPERYYANLVVDSSPIAEGLYAPVYAGGKPVGTVWVITHDATREFDAEDARLIQSLSHLAAGVYPLITAQDAQERQEEHAQSLRDVNAGLLVSSIRQHELTEQAQQSETALRESEEQLVSELASTQRLQETSTELISDVDGDVLYQHILDAAVTIMHSDYGSIQMLYPERSSDAKLRLLAYRGFTPDAARLWEWVQPASDSTSCGLALRTSKRVVVRDVEQCECMAGTEHLKMYLQTGIHSMQSTPLVSRSGRLLGMISTHWRQTHQPAERDLHLLDVLARQAADFIDRSQVERALRESEVRYRTLFDLGPVAIYSCDASGVIQKFNNRAAELWGRRPEPGDTDERFCGSLRLFRPDGSFMPHEECPMAEVVSGRIDEVCDAEVLIERPDSSRVTVVVNIRPLTNELGVVTGAINCFYDITERKRAEEALREGAERQRFMAESMPQKIFTAKASGALEYLNQQWKDFTGLTSGQLRSGWHQFVFPGEVEATERAWRHSVESGQPFKCVHRFRRHDGSYRWHLSRAHAMRNASGNISMWIGSNTDIHEEKEKEEELKRLNEDLNQFAFAASHDFQEPLRMITSYSQLLLRGYSGQLAGEAAVCVGFITEGTKRMRELLSDLLSFTEAGSDRDAAAESIDLNLIFEKAAQNLKSAIDETGATVSSDHLPAVLGRQAHFIQLFQNLIGNAIKYRGERPPVVHVSAEQRPGEWLFAVSDNGMGIEPEYHEQIFGVFKRLHGRSIPGTGIGLAICQRVVERYGGRIWVESELGHVSTFCFTVPFLI